MKNKLTKIVFAALALGFFAVSADGVMAQKNNRQARREYKREVREARREYRDDIRRGDSRRAARREYRNEVRDARREYREDRRDIRRNNNYYRNRPRGRAYGYYNRRPYVGNRRYNNAPRRGIDSMPRRNRY